MKKGNLTKHKRLRKFNKFKKKQHKYLRIKFNKAKSIQKAFTKAITKGKLKKAIKKVKLKKVTSYKGLRNFTKAKRLMKTGPKAITGESIQQVKKTTTNILGFKKAITKGFRTTDAIRKAFTKANTKANTDVK